MRARFALLLVLLAAAPLHAADPLIERLGDSATALKAHDYAKALKISNRTIDDMREALGPGETETKWFAVALTHKALALAGLGDAEEAAWQWQFAQNLYPAVAQSDMMPFGAPAEVLKQHPLTPLNAQPLRVGDKVGEQKVEAPQVVTRTEPLYPRGARSFHISGIVIMESLIDRDGNVRDIHLLRGLPAPTLTYAAMEALRKWKFRPGTMDGKPVDVLFHLTINYILRK